VVFVEVKTGGSVLSKRERWVRDIVHSGKVAWEQIKMKGSSVKVGVD
jgi:predicted Holliday junction resolvase-like endonuclease